MKEYRQNSHTFSLAFWAALCTATAIVLFVHSHKIVSRALKAEEILAGVAFLIFGPAALAVYVIRSRAVWVSVDHVRGLVVNGTRTIPWEEVYRVERRRPRLRRESGPTQARPWSLDSANLAGGCADGCLIGGSEAVIVLLILGAALFVFWLVFFALVPLLILPLLEVFAPFGDRIRIQSRRGTLVLRDLSDADEFMAAVAQRRPVTEE
jgi:hypothetical protein